MGIVLSVATCGVFSTSSDVSRNDIANGPTIGDVVNGARRVVNGERAKEIKAQDVFERQTRVQRAIEDRENACADLRVRIEEHNKRALKLYGVLKQQPPISAAAKAKATSEAQIALRARNALTIQLQQQTKMIEVARRGLSAATAVKNTESDKQLMLDVAALTRELKFDDADVTAISDAGIEVMDNAADLEQHQEEIGNALMTLNDTNQDAGLPFDLSHEDSLLAALAELETEVQNEQRATTSATPAKKPSRKAPQPATNNAPVDNADIFTTPSSTETVNFPPMPAPATLFYSGSMADSAKRQATSKRLAVAETTDGQFKPSQGNPNLIRSRTGTSANANSELNFF